MGSDDAILLSEEQRVALKRLARLELIRRYAERGAILEWGHYLFPDKFPLPFCKEMHEYFVDIRKDEFTVTEAPRNHAKTTIKCFLIPIFQALVEPDAFRFYLNVQATDKKALAINRAIQIELEENEDLKVLYGSQKSARWTAEEFILKNGTIFKAVSTGQSIRGVHYRNRRPSYILVDDLYDEDDINNPDSTIKKNDWFWGTLYPARGKGMPVSFHVQGTAINTEDLLEKLKKNPQWKNRTFQAITDWEKKTVLWPQLNTFEQLEVDLKSMGSVIFYREMQNERRDETSAIVKRSWLKDWEYDPADLKFDTHHFVQHNILGVDPSIGEKSENDATGMAQVYRASWDDGRGNVYYIHDLWNEHLSLDARVRKVDSIKERAAGTKYQLSYANVEAIAGFKDFCAELKRRTNVPVREIDQVKDKISNLENKSHYFENGKVFINKNIDPVLKDMLVHQLTTNHPKHDDLRDAVLLCLDDSSGLWNFV